MRSGEVGVSVGDGTSPPEVEALRRRIASGWRPKLRLAARSAVSADLMRALLEVAERRGGELTVTQGVMASGMDFDEVEECLRGMVDKGYVDVDNAPGSGVVVYRFSELAGN